MRPQCLDCGACCFGDSDEYVAVLGDDYSRLGDAAEELVTVVGNKRFMTMKDRHCIALELRGGRFVCSVYENRPAVCRTLERGSPACTAEYELKSKRARNLLLR